MKFGPITLDMIDLGSRSNAVLGIKDSGKSYTATELAEGMFDAGIPFIAFDPTGVWRYLRVPAKGKGRPVIVIGGPDGDLPLNPMTVGKIVEAALEHGLSLVIDLTGDLSKAEWRRIVRDCVRLLMQKNKDHGLRHVFLEEAAEFVPQRVTDGLVYAEVEKLARIGGNMRLGCTLISQRAEEVNKAVLELCDNLFLHRQKGRNSLQNLTKWLDIADVKDTDVVIKSMANLPTGECWVWLAGSEQPKRVKVPKKDSFHPDRRVLRSAVKMSTMVPIGVEGFKQQLLAQLPQIEAEAEANDPARLRARIAELERENEALAKADGRPVVDEGAIFEQGRAAGRREVLSSLTLGTNQLREKIFAHADAINDQLRGIAGDVRELFVDRPSSEVVLAEARRPVPDTAWTGRLPGVLAAGIPRGTAPAPKQKATDAILSALAFLHSVGEKLPSKPQVALWAGVSPNSGSYAQNLAKLKEAGLIEYPLGGVALTDEGIRVTPPTRMTIEQVFQKLYDRVTSAQGAIMKSLVDRHPRPMRKDEIAAVVGVSANSGSFAQNLGALKALGVITYPQPGTAAVADICFPNPRR